MPERYAGFWIRFVAALIDRVPLRFVQFLISFFVVYIPGKFATLIFANLVLMFVIDAAYEIIMTAKYGGTVGKLLLNLRVISNNKNISYWRSTGRYFAKFLSAAVMYIGYVMIAFTKKRQGLHDLLADTTVVYSKPALSARVRTTLLTLLLILIAGYALWACIFQVGGLTSLFTAVATKVDSNNPVNSIRTACDSQFFFDACVMYAAHFHQTDLTTEQYLQLCNLTGGQERTACVTLRAQLANDTSLCSSLGSGYQRKSCEKGASINDFKFSMASVIANQESHDSFPGRLNSSELLYGYSDGNSCLVDSTLTANLTFPHGQSDSICFLTNNIHPFIPDSQGLHKFGFLIDIKNSTGQYVNYDHPTESNIQHELLTDNTMSDWFTYFSVKNYAAGTYTYQYVVYDFVGRAQIQYNGTITIT